MKKQITNPFLPSGEYIPDGEPHIFGDRLYLYGSHDIFEDELPCTGDYVCWSAPVRDLSDWRYDGVIYGRSCDPMNGSGEMRMYAPDVTEGPDGRYYLFYMLNHVSRVSVAVCDTPNGKFEFYGFVHYPDGTLLGEKQGDEKQFDPAVYTEGNKTYLYTGFCREGHRENHGAMVTVLDEDMITVITPPEVIVPGIMYSKGTSFEEHPYFEAPSMRRINRKYYFIYSSTVMHELCYAVSSSPNREFKFGGVIVSNCDRVAASENPRVCSRGGNNHGSIAVVGDKAYVFYHRHTDGVWSSRQACAEEIKILPDGSIPQVVMTSCGLNGGPLECDRTYSVDICSGLSFPDMPMYTGDSGLPRITQSSDADGGKPYIADMTDGTSALYRYFDFSGKTRIKVKSKGYNGIIEFRIPELRYITYTKVPDSSDWVESEALIEETEDLPEISGTYSLEIIYFGKGKRDLSELKLEKVRSFS